MPGPLLTVTIAESSRRGMLTGPMLIVGHGLLELTVVIALLSGFAPLLLRNDVFVTVSLVGGAILLWMALSMLRGLPNLCLEHDKKTSRSENIIVTGAVLSALNPYFILWWATIGLGYIVYSATFGIAGIIFFFLGHILADLGWYSCVSWMIVKGKRFISNTSYRRIIAGCAVFLLVFAGYFFYSGIERLL